MRREALSRLSDLILHSPVAVVAIVGALSIACFRYSTELPYSTSRIDLIPRDHPARMRFLELVRQFGPQNTVAVVVEGGAAADRRRFADSVASGLRQAPEFRGTILHRIDLEPMLERGPFYLDASALEEIADDVDRNGQLVAGLPDIGSLLRTVHRRLEDGAARGLDSLPEVIPAAKRMESLFRVMRENLEGKVVDRRSWMAILGGETIPALELFDEKGFLTARDGSRHFLFVTPDRQSEELDYLVPFVTGIRRAIQAARQTAPAVSASLTGIPIQVIDEFESTQRDLPRSTAAAFVGNLLILLFGFGLRLRMAILIMLALAAGISWTMAFAKLTLGSLNLVSSVFVLFLLGMGINYGIYFATRFDLERRRGLERETALRKVMQEQGMGILSSALAGSIAFLTLCLCPFRGFQELGLIAGFGLIFCLVAGTLLLPPLLLLTEGTSPLSQSPPRPALFHWIVVLVEAHPLPIVLWFCFLTAYAASAGDPFPFDYDLNRMLPAESESLVAGEKLLASRTLSPLSAIVFAKDTTELYDRDRQLRRRPAVEMTLSWASFVPDDIVRKRELLRTIEKRVWARLPGAVAKEPLDPMPARRELADLEDTLASSVRSLETLARYAEAAAGRRALDEMRAFRSAVEGLSPAELPGRLTNLGNALRQSWLDLVGEVRRWCDAPDPDEKLVPRELRAALRSAEGRFAIVVSPREDVNQKDAFERFHSAVAEVEPDMTGYPVIIHTMVGLLPAVLESTSVKAVLFIALLLAIDLKNTRRIALAIFPVIVGSIWLMGLMKWLGLRYNPVNFLALPMILGVGIENGVNFVHGFGDEDSAEALDTQGLGMLLSAGTSIVGFEALAFVSHRGLASFGYLLTIGTMTCLLATLFFLPAVVELEAHGDRLKAHWRRLIGYRFY